MTPPSSRPASSVVEHVVEKLSSDDRIKVTKDVITTAEETLRKVAIKIKVGGLGKGDSVENRAAIVLDLILRRNGIATISNLSKICTMKKKDFESMSAKVGNYMETNQQQHRQQAQGHQSRRASPRFKVTRPQAALTVPVSDRSSIIPILSIKLGSHIPDSFGFAKLAQHLLKDIQVHLWGLKDKFQRSGYLQDMERKMTEYEAACFFLIMEENHVKDVDKLKPLLMEAANVQLGEFEDIYKEAKKFHEVLRLKKKRLFPVEIVSTKRQRTQPSSIRHKLTAELAELTESIEKGVVTSVAHGKAHAALATYTYSNAFQTWRSQTLANAMEQARSSEGDNLSDAQALHKAADAILLQFGETTS